MKKVALIVAGGKGKRMNNTTPKQFLLLNNLPILMHTIMKFSHFEKTVLVLPEEYLQYWQGLCRQYHFNEQHVLVIGGENRFQSVKNGLKKIDDKSIVMIHDGVRPILSKNLLNILIKHSKKGVGVIPVIPIKDSIRRVEGETSKHIERKNIYQVQTPQCFRSDDIKNAYKVKFSDFFTDDASVLENMGGKITTVLGDKKNLKITTKEDLKVAEVFIR